MTTIVENTEPNPIVFFDITIEDEKVGRIIIELFKDTCPKTVESFRVLCTGERENGLLRKRLHYKGSIFHKVVPECLIQGGDITHFDGCGGDTIYGPVFADENFKIKHEFGGEVSLANRGRPNTNNSQFCITTVPCPHLDGAHVVFGKVLKGMDVVREISYVPVGPEERPVPECKIVECGEIKPGEDWGVNEVDGNGICVPPYPTDWDKAPNELGENSIMKVVTVVKNSGNQFYRNGKLLDAIRKYKKALRYMTWYKAHLNKIGNHEKASLFQDIELHCNLNCALVKVKKGHYKEAMAYCAAALKIDNKNVKAMCRRAQANFALANYEQALEDYKKAQKLSPNNSCIENELRRVRRAISDYVKFEKVTYARMFPKS